MSTSRPERQIAVFEVEFTADDKITRRRWNGGPMASKEASDALFEAVEAFRTVLAKHGYEKGAASYGVRAEDYPRG